MRPYPVLLGLLMLPLACQVIADIEDLERSNSSNLGGVGGASGDAGSAAVGGETAGSAANASGGDAGTPGCPRNTKDCSDNVPRYCGDDGEWHEQPACSGSTPRCKDGACIEPPSCEASSVKCGANAESCCTTLLVTGGEFERELIAGKKGKVSSFWLDKYEITVGRFKKFIESGGGTVEHPPLEGSGKHPKIDGSGWQSRWNSQLAASSAIQNSLKCDPQLQTWDQETLNKPINCITWFEAFAFCIWDGGRLPTEAEWTYTAIGAGAGEGVKPTAFPWGDIRPAAGDVTRAIWGCYFADGKGTCTQNSIAPVGSAPGGAQVVYKQLDLAGNILEWVFDWKNDQYPPSCIDCAETAESPGRVARGGHFETKDPEFDDGSGYFRGEPISPENRRRHLGARCARDVISPAAP